VGEKQARRAASTDAACNNGCPLNARASSMQPRSFTTILTATAPDARAAFAIGGYGGFGKLMARPFNIPPSIGALDDTS